VQGGELDHDAADLHRLHVREGRDAAGAADVDPDVVQEVVASSGGYLCAIAQRGALLVAPSRRCSGTWSTFTTTPSISCSTSCRCSPQWAM
jgi:hypothetical protein